MMDNDNSVTDKIDMDASRDKQAKVPIEELEALADEWVEMAPYIHGDSAPQRLERCADQLREVIAEYE